MTRDTKFVLFELFIALLGFLGVWYFWPDPYGVFSLSFSSGAACAFALVIFNQRKYALLRVLD